MSVISGHYVPGVFVKTTYFLYYLNRKVYLHLCILNAHHFTGQTLLFVVQVNALLFCQPHKLRDVIQLV